MVFDDPPTFTPAQSFEGSPEPATSAPERVQAAVAKMPPAPAHPESEFKFTTVEDFAALYRSGQVTPLLVAQEFLRVCQEQDIKDLNVWVAQNSDDILQQAQASTERYSAGKPLSVFDGVPVGVKDEFHQIGYPTTVGTSYTMYPEIQKEDATVVGRLRAAGALLVGKAVMSEIGICVLGLQAHHGTARNPYNPVHHTGGSSSGSAAAVAAGLCPVALGADGGGSVRIPAALCGLYGLKATYGRLSEHGAAPLCWTVGHGGPLCATARDLVLAYACMQGSDPKDPLSTQPVESLANLDGGVKGLRIAIDRRWAHDANPEIVTRMNETLACFQAAGATVTDIEIPELDEMRCAHTLTILSEMCTCVDGHYRTNWTDFGMDTRVKLALGNAITNVAYIHSQRMRTRAIALFRGIFEKFDVVVTPTTGTTAPKIALDCLPEGESNLPVAAPIMRFVQPGNLTGFPAMSMPIGVDSEGLPIGLQLYAGPWQESTLLRAALFWESSGGGKRAKPQVFCPLLQRTMAARK
eukprot:CAMPEP_0114557214 /NCGR_PEP_ID=MMETSP0114-20121206/9709_1 /TAXON_ID=31324 /ORGANISM="Goniomonas sp, Strain m" /LENGTH=523 /DNA_ID=CAMNT_0001742483 /DNA_START=118 /DNA_END=1686 /DNA_ORIENTATION=-